MTEPCPHSSGGGRSDGGASGVVSAEAALLGLQMPISPCAHTWPLSTHIPAVSSLSNKDTVMLD